MSSRASRSLTGHWPRPSRTWRECSASSPACTQTKPTRPRRTWSSRGWTPPRGGAGRPGGPAGLGRGDGDGGWAGGRGWTGGRVTRWRDRAGGRGGRAGGAGGAGARRRRRGGGRRQGLDRGQGLDRSQGLGRGNGPGRGRDGGARGVMQRPADGLATGGGGKGGV